ncbi:5'-nucleotidase SurE [Frankliniella fusca]|uniref:5'-nucleotidase SurE n=1 Tax=Frankliniella fusca TaxID=407009 RepID=A0AAE1LAV4_9NEOP|nr:5'-nucleotidase SurE [Frankliniella fusca]
METMVALQQTVKGFIHQQRDNPDDQSSFSHYISEAALDDRPGLRLDVNEGPFTQPQRPSDAVGSHAMFIRWFDSSSSGSSGADEHAGGGGGGGAGLAWCSCTCSPTLALTVLATACSTALLVCAVITDHWEHVAWDRERVARVEQSLLQAQRNASAHHWRLDWLVDGKVARLLKRRPRQPDAGPAPAPAPALFLLPMNGGIWTLCANVNEEQHAALRAAGLRQPPCVNYLTRSPGKDGRPSWQHRMQNLSISCALVCLIILGSSAIVGAFGVAAHQASAVLVTGVLYLLAGERPRSSRAGTTPADRFRRALSSLCLSRTHEVHRIGARETERDERALRNQSPDHCLSYSATFALFTLTIIHFKRAQSPAALGRGAGALAVDGVMPGIISPVPAPAEPAAAPPPGLLGPAAPAAPGPAPAASASAPAPAVLPPPPLWGPLLAARRVETAWSLQLGWGGVAGALLTAALWLTLSRAMRGPPPP